MKKTIIAAISIILMLFAFVACDGEPTKPSETEPTTAEVTASVNDILTAIFKDVTELKDKPGTWTTEEYSGDYSFTVGTDNKSWTLTADGSEIPEEEETPDAKATESEEETVSDISISLKYDGSKYSEFKVSVKGEEYKDVKVADAMKGITPPKAEEEEEPETPFAWDISVRLAKHNEQNGFNDHDNYRFVDSKIEKDSAGAYYVVKADLDRLVTYTSTNKDQGEGKWIALLIGTGASDIKTVSYEGTPFNDNDINERNDMLGSDGTAVASDEFVLWLKAGEEETTKEFTLSYPGDDEVEAQKVTIKIEDWTDCTVKDEISIHARAAKHKTEFEGYDNSKHISSLTVTENEEGYKIEISAKTSEMKSFTSTDSEQAKKGDKKWFPILVSTGVADIKKISYEGKLLTDADITERTEVKGVDDREAASDEFVLWLYAEDETLKENAESPKTFNLVLGETAEDSTVTKVVISLKEITE